MPSASWAVQIGVGVRLQMGTAGRDILQAGLDSTLQVAALQDCTCLGAGVLQKGKDFADRAWLRIGRLDVESSQNSVILDCSKDLQCIACIGHREIC